MADIQGMTDQEFMAANGGGDAPAPAAPKRRAVQPSVHSYSDDDFAKIKADPTLLPVVNPGQLLKPEQKTALQTQYPELFAPTVDHGAGPQMANINTHIGDVSTLGQRVMTAAPLDKKTTEAIKDEYEQVTRKAKAGEGMGSILEMFRSSDSPIYSNLKDPGKRNQALATVSLIEAMKGAKETDTAKLDPRIIMDTMIPNDRDTPEVRTQKRDRFATMLRGMAGELPKDDWRNTYQHIKAAEGVRGFKEPVAAAPVPGQAAGATSAAPVPGQAPQASTPDADPNVDTEPNAFESFIHGAAQGGLGGFGTSAAAAIDYGASKVPGLRDLAAKVSGDETLTDPSLTYDQRRQNEYARLSAAKTAHPLATTIGSAVGTGAEVAAAGIAAPETMLGAAGMGAVGAASQAAGERVGAGGSATDALKDAAMAAPLGAVAGPAAKFLAGAAGKVLSPAAKFATEKLLRVNPVTATPIMEKLAENEASQAPAGVFNTAERETLKQSVADTARKFEPLYQMIVKGGANKGQLASATKLVDNMENGLQDEVAGIPGGRSILDRMKKAYQENDMALLPDLSKQLEARIPEKSRQAVIDLTNAQRLLAAGREQAGHGMSSSFGATHPGALVANPSMEASDLMKPTFAIPRHKMYLALGAANVAKNAVPNILRELTDAAASGTPTLKLLALKAISEYGIPQNLVARAINAGSDQRQTKAAPPAVATTP